MPARTSKLLKELKGTVRPGREVSRSRDFLEKPPVAPEYLSDRAAVEWKRIAADACNVGMAAADTRSLALLAETLATETELRNVLEKEGHTVKGANGGTKAHPALSALAQTRQQAHALLQAFGLTPKGRQTLPPAKKKIGSSPFAKYVHPLKR